MSVDETKKKEKGKKRKNRKTCRKIKGRELRIKMKEEKLTESSSEKGKCVYQELMQRMLRIERKQNWSSLRLKIEERMESFLAFYFHIFRYY